MFSPNEPIVQQFRAAARLINEWRDTLSYGTLSIIGLDDLIVNHQYDQNLLWLVSTREVARAYAWGFGHERSLVGVSARTQNKDQLCYSSTSVSMMVVITNFILLPGQRDLLGLIVAAGATFAMIYYGFKAHGPIEVFKAYKDVMWDYPRKSGGGGTTQTQRLMDGFSSFGRQFAGKLGGMATKPSASRTFCLKPVATPR